MWNNNNNNQYQQPPPQGQGQWGAPPPQQYGAPTQQYGAPTQQYGAPPVQQQYGGTAGGYNAPPPQQGGYAPPPTAPYGQQQPYGNNGGYNAPPPQQGGYAPPPTAPYGQQQPYGNNGGYNAPPPQQGGYAPPPTAPYGVPPPQQQWNAPPPQQQMGQYGAPPPVMNGGQPFFLGVPVPHDPPSTAVGSMQGYNASFDAERVRKATKGFGTDEKVLIDTMSPLDAFQMDQLSRTYEQLVGRTLQKTLEKELSSWLEYTLVLLSLGPLQGDVYLLHRACKGAGTHEDLLNEILLSRTNQEINMLKQAYQRKHSKDLAAVVRGELSMKTERMFNMALAAGRDESTFVNQQSVENDVATIYRAGPGKIGTDEIAICGIMLQRSDAHLRALAQSFQMKHRTSLSSMINSEFSGHMRDGLYHVARKYEADGDGVQRDAEGLERAMAGAGTKDERLIYRLVRFHWNRQRFGAIKNAYNATYKTTLRRRVEGETTGKYEKALVGIIEQN